MVISLYDIMDEALDLWAKIRNISDDGPMDYDLDSECREIKEAQKIDNTGLTALMLLNAQVRHYGQEQSFTMLECLEDKSVVNSKLRQLRKLLDILNQETAKNAVSEFQQQIGEMAKVCEVEGVFDELINDIIQLAYIRRDALIAIKYLRLFNFKRGKRAEKLHYNKSIIKFWNINSALRAAEVQPKDGITLVMIRDPIVLYSHFMFLVHDGENITVWTDQEDEDHPLQKYMSRSRGQERRWDTRAFKLRFPYQLFDLEFDDDGRYIKEEGRDALVRTNIEAVPIIELRELPPDQVLWILMMFDVISNKAHPKIKSHTGEGIIKTNRKLIGSVSTSDITRKDMTKQSLKKKRVFERESTGKNDWLEERYASKVPEQVFNIIASKDGPALLSDGSSFDVKSVIKDKSRITVNGYSDSLNLIGIEPRVFDTPKRMRSDRLWIARYNQALVIQRLADKEYNRKHKHVKRWYEDAIKENIDFILEAVAKGTLSGMVRHRENFSTKSKKGNILSQCMRRRWAPFGWNSQVKLYTWDYDRARCYLSEQLAWIWTWISPIVVEDLSRLVGKEVPEIIQNWTMLDSYVGNSILDRLDPVDWKLEDPWGKLKFDILIGLSRQEFNNLLKKHRLPYRKVEAHENP